MKRKLCSDLITIIKKSLYCQYYLGVEKNLQTFNACNND